MTEPIVGPTQRKQTPGNDSIHAKNPLNANENYCIYLRLPKCRVPSVRCC